MDKIKRVEQLRKRWKACKPPDENIHGIISIKKCKGGVIALEQALDILKQPSNTTMQIDTEPCVNCNFYKTNVRFRFCPDCGLALSD